MHTTSHKRSTQKRGLRPVFLALMALLLASCGSSPTPLPQLAVPTAIPAATTAPTAAEAAPPATAPAAPAEATSAATQAAPVPLTGQGQTFQVDLTDNAFSPVDLTIPVGSKVVWTNKGQRSHTVTADDGSFKSDTLKNGDVFEHVFDQAGTFLYYCEFHGGPNGQGMAAAVSVSPGSAQPAPAATTAPPAATQPPAPAAPEPTQPAAPAAPSRPNRLLPPRLPRPSR